MRRKQTACAPRPMQGHFVRGLLMVWKPYHSGLEKDALEKTSNLFRESLVGKIRLRKGKTGLTACLQEGRTDPDILSVRRIIMNNRRKVRGMHAFLTGS